MKQSFAIVNEISENLLLESLMDFASQYSGNKFAENIMLYRKKEAESFLVLFTNVPNFDHFSFMINFIHYIQTPSKKLPSVLGYYLNDSKLNTQYFLNEYFTKVYVSRNDKEYDNVNAVTQNNESYLYNFGGKISKLSLIEESYEVPTLDMNTFNHVLDIIPTPNENKPWWKMW